MLMPSSGLRDDLAAARTSRSARRRRRDDDARAGAGLTPAGPRSPTRSAN
jgi:hypothetical protein